MLPDCLRRPCGPSVIITDGMPTRSIAFVVQKSAPLVSEAFSSRVRSEAEFSVIVFLSRATAMSLRKPYAFQY